MKQEINHLFKDCIIGILESAEEAMGYPDGDYKDGALLAYATALCTIKYKLELLDPENMIEYGLDFDVDKKFLCSD